MIDRRRTSSGEVRYEVRLRGTGGNERSRTFRTKKDAERYERTQLAAIEHGLWIDPRAGKVTLEAWATEWQRTVVHLRESTQRIYGANLRNHILPELGDIELGKLSPRMLRAWLSGLTTKIGRRGKPLAPGSVVQAYRTLNRVLAAAVDDELLGRNPLRGVKPPKARSVEMRFLTQGEVATLAAQIDARYRAFVLVAAYTGLRAGELMGLRRRHLDLLRRSITVIDQVQYIGGRHQVLTPKTAAGKRSVAVPATVVRALEAVYAAIVAAPQPYSAHNWLRSSAAAAILGELAAGTLPLSHEALDAHPRRRGADYRRHLLVANGVLPARHDALARLEAWVATRLRVIEDHHQRRLLRSHAAWRVLRRARQRGERSGPLRTPTAHAKNNLNAAIAFVEFLGHRGHEPPAAPKPTSTPGSTRDHQARPASSTSSNGPQPKSSSNASPSPAHTAEKARPSTMTLAGPSWGGSYTTKTSTSPTESPAVSCCSTDNSYRASSDSPADQITSKNDTVRLQIGATHIEVPEPLASLITRLARGGRPYVGVGTPAVIPWLFPGLDPGRPLTAYRLGQRLHNLGLDPQSGRRSALTHLGARFPATTLAGLLNLAPTTAVYWVRASGGDWTNYAAQLIHDREP